ncbi:MAG TPA: LysR substrate-binding domain-containing protein [Oxalicibacterium sp.]|uniref:LysR family transcriptional regulator n=1 Tax=Oxalicibacterium sp. TaxID=2766525 RepID=UPI002BC028DD|nr:LysR substrate-binding domain-containing protein [Oxalicibacterium sp.]HWU97528.1 LysR substrate-binding domain-containing protein [Oxalicibacterium sp.]
METLNSIECFVRSAEAGSFSEAARRLGLTSAAVGKNVAKLEANLGVRLFQRSTRSLKLTEAGERFLAEVGNGLATIQNAVANLASSDGQPAGNLKISMGSSFGRTYIVPLLTDFLQRYPAITPDWHFDNRRVDMVAEGFDAAIGGGFELPPSVVARALGPAHGILVAAPDYFEDRKMPRSPADLDQYDGILIRSPQIGRVRSWPLRNRANEQMSLTLRPRMTMSDQDAASEATQAGLGIALISMPHALPYLNSKKLIRVLPDWYVDMGTISLYFSAQKLLPAKTRVFVDFVVEHFRQEKLAKRFSAI